MKLVILEGQDNLGKTTIIREICKDFKSYFVRKFNSPPSDLNSFQKERFQKESFLFEFRFYTNLCRMGNFDQEETVMIWDRSHIGEQVYGPLFRKSDPTKWLSELEKSFSLEDVYLIWLKGHHDFVIKNEDGFSLKLDGLNRSINSFSYELRNYVTRVPDSSLSDLQRLKMMENDLFNYAYDKTHIPNKIQVEVDRDLEFRNLGEIMQEIKQFINE